MRCVYAVHYAHLFLCLCLSCAPFSWYLIVMSQWSKSTITTSTKGRSKKRNHSARKQDKAVPKKRSARCPHVRTTYVVTGSAFFVKSGTCLDCGKVVQPCVRCLCFITRGNLHRHLYTCQGSRYELQLAGSIGSRVSVAESGKFSKTEKRIRRLPGRGKTMELFNSSR